MRLIKLFIKIENILLASAFIALVAFLILKSSVLFLAIISFTLLALFSTLKALILPFFSLMHFKKITYPTVYLFEGNAIAIAVIAILYNVADWPGKEMISYLALAALIVSIGVVFLYRWLNMTELFKYKKLMNRSLVTLVVSILCLFLFRNIV